jgi:hypothetical protein
MRILPKTVQLSSRLTGWRQTAFVAVAPTATLPLVRAIFPAVNGGLGLAAFFAVLAGSMSGCLAQ